MGEKNGNSDRLYFLGLQKSLQMVTAAMKLKDACSLEKQKHHFANKGPYSQSYGFSSSHAQPSRRLCTKESMLSNCGSGEDS